MARSETEWEEALTLGLGLLVLYKLSDSGSSLRDTLRSLFEPSGLPRGMRLPGTGDMREVPAVKTPLDPRGFPALFNQALQIVESETFALESWLAEKDLVNLQPSVPAPDPDYDGPAAVFAAQTAVETGDGEAVWNNNTGNVHTSRGDYFRLPQAEAHEHSGPQYFESFNFPLQGAIAQVARVKRLWPEAYKLAFNGPSEPVIRAFAHALAAKPPMYFTSDPDKYASGMLARAERFGWKVAGWDDGSA